MGEHILEPEVTLDHLSPSSIRMYLMCPRQWWYRYVLGMKIAPDGGLVSGIAFHNTAEACLKAKIETGENTPVEEAEEIARDEAQHGLEDAVLLEDQSRGSVVDKTVRLTSAWAENALPESRPHSVEQEWELDLGSVRVIGRIDMIAEDGHVVDWKTTGKAPPKPEALAANPQTGLYSAATGAETVEYVHIVDSKSKGPYVQSVEVPKELVTRSRELSQELAVDVAGACQSGYFPRNTNGWHCSARWCGFYSRCMSGKDKP
jgi:CRISPR/Cas system-associated exonuclease Cas4 (RecB family)